MKAIYPIFAAVLILGASVAFAQPSAKDTLSLFNLMEKIPDEKLSVTITSNFQHLISNKFNEEYQPATFSFKGPDGELLEFDMKIKTRGNSRKQICFYPPLKLNFKKSGLRSRSLMPLDQYKMVTQCRSGRVFESYVMKEYMAYKLLEAAYPYTFKVRLISINFRDIRNNGKIKESERLGFVIESEEELARRLNAKIVERNKSGFHHLERKMALQMALAQYMIGNTDWAMPNLHNMKIIKVPDFEKMVPVPYDFDYSGLVDADYAVVHHSLSIKSVRDRLYIGPSCTESEVEELIGLFSEKKEKLLECIHSCETMEDRDKKRLISYLEDFFEEVGNENRMKSVLDY